MSPSKKGYHLNAVAVTPDQRFIIGGGPNQANNPGSIRFWDFKTGALIRSDKWKHYELVSILVTPDSRSIVVSGRDDRWMHYGSRYVYSGDIETGKYQLIKSYPDGSMRLSLTRDKKYVKFGDYLWNWQTKAEVRPQRKWSKRIQDTVLSIVAGPLPTPDFTTAYTTDQQYAVVLGQGDHGSNIRVIDLQTGERKLHILAQQL
jgi:WD40 repeat protein